MIQSQYARNLFWASNDAALELKPNQHNKMDLRALRRPLCDILSVSRQSVIAGNANARRCESSYRRSKMMWSCAGDSFVRPNEASGLTFSFFFERR